MDSLHKSNPFLLRWCQISYINGKSSNYVFTSKMALRNFSLKLANDMGNFCSKFFESMYFSLDGI